jgi:hypothetical protein
MTRQSDRAVLAVLALALSAAACASGRSLDPESPASRGDSGSGNGSTPGGGAGAPSGSSGTGGSSSSGSSSGGASGGGNLPGASSGGATGTGGTSGYGGSSGSADAGVNLPDAGSSSDAAPGQPACTIELYGVTSPKLTDEIPAIEGARYRVGARASGTAIPTKPVWRWAVTHASGKAIAHMGVDGEPAQIDVPTVMEGRYDIVAELVDVSGCQAARGSIFATRPINRVLNLLLRVTPPAGKNFPIIESSIYVQAGTPASIPLQFRPLPIVDVAPHDESNLSLPAYFVQVSSPSSSVKVEAYIDARTARPPYLRLPVVPERSYQLLIIPDAPDAPDSTTATRAPILFGPLLGEEINTRKLLVDAGLAVTGKITSNSGPLRGSRLRLRDNLLPSTVGDADPAGVYSLRTRPGTFEARVLPPADSGLPEAQVPRSAGIAIDANLGTLDFSYGAVTMAKLTLTVKTADGQPPAQPVTVRLESLEGELRNVGQFLSPGRPPVSADGIVRLSKPTANGIVVFDRVPRAQYRLVLQPAEDAPGDWALTTVPKLDLSNAAAEVAETVTLAKRGRITGTLTPLDKAAGLYVRAVDVGEDGVRPKDRLVAVNAQGKFELASDPGRVYRIFVEPPADRRVPRVLLTPVRATAGTVTIEATLPLRLSLNGSTLGPVGEPLPGAVIQVFCRSRAPGCVDPDRLDVSSTLPLDETVSGVDGRYQIWLPDPGQ